MICKYHIKPAFDLRVSRAFACILLQFFSSYVYDSDMMSELLWLVIFLVSFTTMSDSVQQPFCNFT